MFETLQTAVPVLGFRIYDLDIKSPQKSIDHIFFTCFTLYKL
jgi:hypothetical protein